MSSNVVDLSALRKTSTSETKEQILDRVDMSIREFLQANMDSGKKIHGFIGCFVMEDDSMPMMADVSNDGDLLIMQKVLVRLADDVFWGEAEC